MPCRPPRDGPMTCDGWELVHDEEACCGRRFCGKAGRIRRSVPTRRNRLRGALLPDRRAVRAARRVCSRDPSFARWLGRPIQPAERVRGARTGRRSSRAAIGDDQPGSNTEIRYLRRDVESRCSSSAGGTPCTAEDSALGPRLDDRAQPALQDRAAARASCAPMVDPARRSTGRSGHATRRVPARRAGRARGHMPRGRARARRVLRPHVLCTGGLGCPACRARLPALRSARRRPLRRRLLPRRADRRSSGCAHSGAYAYERLRGWLLAGRSPTLRTGGGDARVQQ